jgi:hypothetical protein
MFYFNTTAFVPAFFQNNVDYTFSDVERDTDLFRESDEKEAIYLTDSLLITVEGNRQEIKVRILPASNLENLGNYGNAKEVSLSALDKTNCDNDGRAKSRIYKVIARQFRKIGCSIYCVPFKNMVVYFS